VAVAWHLSPVRNKDFIAAFAGLMNREAAQLKLGGTRFVEPSGIDENNLTTARDFARFCVEYLRLHPEAIADYHTVPELAYPQEHNLPVYQRGKSSQTILQLNHVPLLGAFDGADGLKTGYIDEAGYNAAVTAQRGDGRFIAVVLGVPAELGATWGARARTEDCRALLAWAFENYKTLRLPSPDIPEPKLWKGTRRTLPLAAGAPAALTTTISRGENLRWEVEVSEPLVAPIQAGRQVGEARLFDDEGLLRSEPVLAAEDVDRGGFFRRLWDSVLLFFRSL
jgi:D-alanyl-D-alanine carboxypeptidase (penicillin-binding protein 5/6)